MNLDNRVIAITGGAQGLGKEIALQLGQSGAKLVLIDINPDILDEAVKTLQAESIEAIGIVANVANESDVEKAFDQILAEFGQIDGLVNNAGIIRDGMLVKAKDGKITDRMSLQQWQQVIDVNLTGVFLCGRAAAERMLTTQNPGVIVNISSISRAGNMGQTNYAAAKAGVAAMTVTWAKELARYKVRCAAIAPGFIATEMTQSMKPEAIERVEQVIPVRRMGAPEEIGATVKFIFENDYVTGRIIEIDGGLRL